ncbi:MAG TPA: class I SAM-dependent RNA methyltransferase [Syntrophales bacterium]|nr:class I SAM-dependent RNA methyltransferase [Syntrophales bacterium]HON23976.1 class I SAM-dependent RNA methyltransferase [Syntrophales bacterium]HOU78097.1 class I SAM-dependent RNA methyltransferase [Syntrophales bacterium]HQG34716.1 class I SAM-dependent RNA methyltransferase [Syntrophales bacterium]HQJ31070.1 class I SAM-dependent RNA methyltransferase [Syntrophales bacterium]
MINLWNDKRPILVTCARGISPYLEREILALGMPVREVSEAAVETTGGMIDAMRLNLCLRTGQRVLMLLHEGRARTPDDLYAAAISLPWEDVLHVDRYFCVTSAVATPAIRDPRYANVRIKDAIVDRLRRLYRRRPDSGSDRTGAVVHLYWQDDLYRIFADTSGEPLSRRGYRKVPLTAPMQETLAAAVLMATGWTGDTPLVNPMCGSGTLAIEAALLARRRGPGILRENFGFLHLRGFDDDLWQHLRLQVRKEERPDFPGRIIASDISPEAVRAAAVNAGRAKMGRHIQLRVCPFAATPVPREQGVVIMNPPYGQRLGADEELERMYGEMGDFLKTGCHGYRGYVFTANLELAKRIGLRTSRRLIFFNGELESRLLEYPLYEGSGKQPRPEAKPPYKSPEEVGGTPRDTEPAAPYARIIKAPGPAAPRKIVKKDPAGRAQVPGTGRRDRRDGGKINRRAGKEH